MMHAGIMQGIQSGSDECFLQRSHRWQPCWLRFRDVKSTLKGPTALPGTIFVPWPLAFIGKVRDDGKSCFWVILDTETTI